MSRQKNMDWNVGEPGQMTMDGAQLAVLMDIRDRLDDMHDKLWGILSIVQCKNATAIPRILRKIEQNTNKKKRGKAK